MKLLYHIIFNFLRNFHTIFCSDCTNLHSHQQFMRVPFSPYPCQYLLLIAFLIPAIITGMKWYPVVVLICISTTKWAWKETLPRLDLEMTVAPLTPWLQACEGLWTETLITDPCPILKQSAQLNCVGILDSQKLLR